MLLCADLELRNKGETEMTKCRVEILGLLVVFVGITCWLGCDRTVTRDQTVAKEQAEPKEQAEAENHRGKFKATDNPVTINWDPNTNNCTQIPVMVGLLSATAQDTVTYSGWDTKNLKAVPVTVRFPDPGSASARLYLPGSPFLNVGTGRYQYAVTNGQPSSGAYVTDRETPNQGNVFYFYYSEIEVNGAPCIINNQQSNIQGMGVSVQR
jgi:hypothetical protein